LIAIAPAQSEYLCRAGRMGDKFDPAGGLLGFPCGTMQLPERVAATPASREKPRSPIGCRGDEALPAPSATGASQLRASPFHFSTAWFWPSDVGGKLPDEFVKHGGMLRSGE